MNRVPEDAGDTGDVARDGAPGVGSGPAWGEAAAPATVGAVETAISAVLRVGVVTSLSLVVAGLLLDLVRHPARQSSAAVGSRLVTSAARYPHSFGAIFSGVAHGSGVAIMSLGLILLVATPVARVAVSVFAFAHSRDPVFVAVTAFVLAVLVGSFALGKVGG